MSKEVDELEKWAEDDPGRRELARLRLRRTNKDLRQLVAVLEDQLEAERERAETLLTVADTPVGDYRVELGERDVKPNPTVTVACLSDTHVEEVVAPAKVNRLNEHSLAIAEERLEHYWRNVVRLVQLTQRDCEVVEHIQWVGGDLFSGHIHDDLLRVTELTPVESVLWLRDRITAGLKFLRRELQVPKITVPWSFGNHGRTTPRSLVAAAAEHNHEWQLGHIVANDLDEVDGISVIVSPGYHLYIDLNDFRLRFHHGDEVRYQGGVGGLTIPLNKAIDAWNRAKHADLDILGHWHQLLFLPNAVVNGSTIGWSPYSIKIKARYEPPQQAFFMVDLARRCRTGCFPIHVT